MVLDQGYWTDGGLTAPDDEALKRDVQLARTMGFNGVRKHQKIEDPRYLYWADRVGLLVWGEMPSAYRFNARSVDRLLDDASPATIAAKPSVSASPTARAASAARAAASVAPARSPIHA